MKTKKTIVYPKKKTTISIVALHKNINTSRQKFTINKSSYNELIQPKSTRSSFSIRNSLITSKPKLSVPLITKHSLNQTKHSILFNGLNKSKNSYETHSTIHSITGFNSKNIKNSKNFLKENGHKTNRTITNLPSGKNYSLGKVKIKSTKCSINSLYVKLDDILGNNINKVQKKMPKKKENVQMDLKQLNVVKLNSYFSEMSLTSQMMVLSYCSAIRDKTLMDGCFKDSPKESLEA